jgi:Protein of unknown function (DUF4019)
MNSRRPVIVAVILVLSVAASLRGADTPEQAAQGAAEKWLALVDSGKYAQSWDAAASAFRTALTKAQWEEAVAKARGPFGKVESRTLLGAKLVHELPGVPPGDYVVIQYQAKFATRTATETITPMKDQDGVWRVSGYYIK